MDRDQRMLERLGQFLECEVRPDAERIDWDTAALRSALEGLCRLELMALKRPIAFGGPELTEIGFQNFNEQIARYSGALAFLQTQHQGVVGMISNSSNEALKSEYLPQMADGRKLVGVGFSQLRRPGPPIMRAEPAEDGYLLNGHVPWVTGWDLFPEFMVAAALPDGRAVFAPVPLTSTQGVSVSAPMRLASMASANTVTVDFESYFVPEARIAAIREPGWIRNSDQINIAMQGSFALGCAQAGLDILLRNAERRVLGFARDAHDRLAAELARLKIETEDARRDVREETTRERLRLRARQIDLMVRCAHAAVASSSGAANSLDHPAQRVYREAMVFTVSAQTGPIMEATLQQITAK
jgi:alkylation response protein AidB-like acyl-CoA dehydrogenase